MEDTCGHVMLVTLPVKLGKSSFYVEIANTKLRSCSFFQWAEFDDDGNPPWFTDSQPSNSLKDENMQAIRLTQ